MERVSAEAERELTERAAAVRKLLHWVSFLVRDDGNCNLGSLPPTHGAVSVYYSTQAGKDVGVYVQ
ncbi:hypothetical protein [Nocardia sp. NBC_01327]|uniref:hypothetical protein n=1 Tax=Nocardia sp. NBC_01327 TaxID=2903593 RepID=UPI002E113E3E|nr:hypothetical protein OG326_42170 [Nocardia sp. NBC_01327]